MKDLQFQILNKRLELIYVVLAGGKEGQREKIKKEIAKLEKSYRLAMCGG